MKQGRTLTITQNTTGCSKHVIEKEKRLQSLHWYYDEAIDNDSSMVLKSVSFSLPAEVTEPSRDKMTAEQRFRKSQSVNDDVKWSEMWSNSKPPISSSSQQKPNSPIFKFSAAETSSYSAKMHSQASMSESSAFSPTSSPNTHGSGYSASWAHVARPPTRKFSQQSCTLQRGENLKKAMSSYDLRSNFVSHEKPQKLGQASSLKKLFKSIRGRSVITTNCSGRTSPSSDSLSAAIVTADSIENLSLTYSPDSGKSFYKSFEDSMFDNTSIVSPGKPHSPTLDSCVKIKATYTGDVWREIGYPGGVIQIPGVDLSLHIATEPEPPSETCGLCSGLERKKSVRERTFSMTSYSKRRFSQSSRTSSRTAPRIKDYNCPGQYENDLDWRLVISLVDPPDCMVLSNKIETYESTYPSKDPPRNLAPSFVLAGPAICLDLADQKLLTRGVVIQVSTNAVLKQDLASIPQNTLLGYDSSQLCTYACLQSSSRFGPYRELRTCYLYGNTMQANLDPSLILNADVLDKGCQLYIVPVVKQQRNQFSLASLWEGISKKSFHVGIYGPSQTFSRSTFCVSISSSGFSPPYLQVQHEKLTALTLRLLDSYVLTVHEVQGYRFTVDTKTSIVLSLQSDSELNNLYFPEDDLRTLPRINRCFVLNALRLKHVNSSSNRQFTIQLTGLKDKRTVQLKCIAASMKSIDYPNSLSQPVTKRLAQTAEASVVTHLVSRRKDYRYLWAIAQEKAKTSLQTTTSIPDENRELFGIQLGLIVKPLIKTKRLSSSLHLLQCELGDYLPLLSAQSIWLNGRNSSKGRKEYRLSYYKHRIGLVQASRISVIEFKQFNGWLHTRVTVKKLVEASVIPVKNLICSTTSIVKKVKSKVTNWCSIAMVLKFGEEFVKSSIDKECDSSLREEKISYFLKKYLDYCAASPRQRCFHQEIIRALLYTEEYDIVVELITDACILSTSIAVGSKWKIFFDIFPKNPSQRLQHNDENATCSSQLNRDLRGKEDSKPAYEFLYNWRKNFGDDHRKAFLELYRSISQMPDLSNHFMELLTRSAMLICTLDSLKKYDTML